MSDIVLVRPEDRSTSTTQTTGMRREEGVGPLTTGNRGLWAGFVITPPGGISGVHHHGDCETAIYVIRGKGRFYFGEKLEKIILVEAGDFLFVPPEAVHQEENLSDAEPLEFIVARNSSGVIVINVPDPRQG